MIKCIFQYLKGTCDHVLTVGGYIDQFNALTAYCDVDHISSPDHRQSIIGYAILVG